MWICQFTLAIFVSVDLIVKAEGEQQQQVVVDVAKERQYNVSPIVRSLCRCSSKSVYILAKVKFLASSLRKVTRALISHHSSQRDASARST